MATADSLKSCAETYCEFKDFAAKLRYNLDMAYEEPCRVEDGYPTPKYICPEKREYAEKVLKFISWTLKSFPSFLNDKRGRFIEMYKFTHYLRTQVSCKEQELNAMKMQPSLFDNEEEEEKKKSLELELKRLRYLLKVLPKGSKYFSSIYY